MAEATFELERMVVMLLSGIVFAVWIGIIQRNILAVGSGNAEVSPITAGFSTLVPGNGLKAPLVVIQNAVKGMFGAVSSAPQRTASIVLRVWWSLWILTCICFVCPFIGPVSPGTNQQQMEVDARMCLLWHTVTALAALAGIVAVAVLTLLKPSRQEPV